MIKCRIFIENSLDYFDKNVFVIIELPSIPRIGEILWLSLSNTHDLEEKASKNIKTAQPYYPEWFYKMNYSNQVLTSDYLKNISFSDAVTVIMVGYDANSEIVKIVLGK